MWGTRSAVLLATLLPLIYEAVGQVSSNTQPRIATQDGHLMLFGGLDRNITLRTSGRGYVNLNGDNLAQLARTAKAASEVVERLRTNVLTDLEQNVQVLQSTVQGPQGLQVRLATVERNVRNGTGTTMDGALGKRVTAINRRLVLLERQVRQLRTLLTTDECSSNPCHNGGTCVDTYNGFFCRCPDNWEGTLCSVDVNECARFAGTDIGCQNGATCINKPGTYECMCNGGWFGVHCTQRTDDCLSAPSEELCGHGTCVSVKGSGSRAYKCICDQGWTTHGGTGPCIWDVDECSSTSRPACSASPPVQCINVPGSFYCGTCPQGYTGNGYYCSDVDECQNNNGGCSISPMVQCINTQGSVVCGQCPPGYQGDGRSCSFLGACNVNHGGCHPLARCLDNPRISQSYVECICPSGYVGSGFGSQGCTPATSGGMSPGSGGWMDPCSRVRCVHGYCAETINGTAMCVCQPGYTGFLCNVPTDPCLSLPCQNGGVCARVPGTSSFSCTCASGFRGATCQEEEQSCGGVVTGLSGTVTFPRFGSAQYGHNINCAWVIVTNTSKVLQLNFTKFELEKSPNCQLDFLQIHDGRSAGAHMLGRYCSTVPNITSTHNKLYLWFRSDHSVAGGGFSFNWNATDPVCGSQHPISFTSHGLLASPGSPGRYPNNRDCYWTLVAPYSRRIQLHFFTMQIEASANCSNDYLEVLSGWQRHQVAIYCNTSHPGPLTLPGNRATLHFHTNEAKNDAGFQISYSSIEGFPGCGGVHTAASGEIRSPNHPDTYLDDLNCVWHIQVPVGERIRVTFLSFSLEASTDCSFDFLAIRTGMDDDAELVGRYCGNSIPPPYTSTSNELVIQFSTDWSYSAEGFRMKYEILCGGVFSGSDGVLKSPYYPNPYPLNRMCIYEIELPPGQAVELCFQDFSVEEGFRRPCRYDFVEVRDGHENGTLLGHFCGESAPCVTSEFNLMWIKFVTDGSVSNRGFYANYSSIDIGCGGILKQPQGSIQTPNYPMIYPYSHTCRWVIVGNPGTVVQLSWQTFHLEPSNYRSACPYDKVAVFDNSSVPGHGGIIGEFCGETLPPILTTTDNMMSIVFSTDNSGSYQGFSATYSILDASRMCGASYFSPKGALQSPNFPNWYPNSKDCTWVLSVPTGQQFQLNVTDFELESGNGCPYDFLEIRNGGTNLAPLIGKYCGTTIPRLIPSMSNQMFLRFRTDSSRMYRGFRITWDGTATGCGGTLTAPSGSIISPNYPQPYGHNGECFWRISVSRGSVIQLVFADLELERHIRCYHDFVEVYDGRDSHARKVGRYCTTDPVIIPLSSSNTMFIKFRSDVSIATRGFHLRYQTVCNNVLRGYRGVIESPNFPNSYPDNTDCTWNITAPRGNKLNITFSHFELEESPWMYLRYGQSPRCGHDYVEVKEGDDNAAPDAVIMSPACGSELPTPIYTSKNHAYVHFVTDFSRTYPGFRLEWVVNGCGGVLTKPFATFTSPGYPGGYPASTTCEWTITVGWGHSVELTISNFSMEITPNCRFDSLTVYSGTDDSGPQITQFCHTHERATVSSSGNNMFVRFISDISYQGRGFSASYRTVDSKCGGKFTAPYGNIHSPNYPQNYDNNLDCRWLIEVEPSYVVFFKFEDYDFNAPNCRQTRIQVFDGNNTNSTELFKGCGRPAPETYNFTSTSNQILVVMVTGNYGSAKGFRASYSIACGARIVAEDTGVISTQNSVHSDNCTWTIIAANPESRVTLHFSMMDVSPNWSSEEDECPYYHIEVRDGDTAEAPLIGSYCGSRAPPHLTSQGSAMFVQAVSEYGGHLGIMKATYSVLSAACGGNLSSEHGSFASPGYPNNYPLESSCVWYIATSPGNRVLLSFRLFELESSEFCNDDYVEVRRDNPIGPVIGVYCGTELPSNLTAAHSLWVKFQSSGAGTAAGFIAEYSMLHGNDLSGPSGQVASPLYPNSYIHRGQFFWRITVDSGSAIAIMFKDFFIDVYMTECYNYLAIYDGFDETATKLFQGCGAVVPDPVTSSSNVVYVELNSNPIRLGSKFLLEWLQVERQIHVVQDTTVGPSIPGCGGLVRLEVSANHSTESYVLTSPGYPEGYADMLDCEWIFETTPLNHLRMYFTDMNVEQYGGDQCYNDYVQVYQGRRGRPDWRLTGTYCLPNTTYTTIWSTNLLKVVFHADYYYNKTGFRAIVDIECGGWLSDVNGVIDVRNETRARHWSSVYNAMQCEWNVTVPTGRTIAVVFEAFNVPSVDTDHCQQNYIILRNGRSNTSPLLGQGRFCGTSLPTNIPETTGNQLNIVFKGTAQQAGFKLRYTAVSVACGGRVQLTDENSATVISSPNYPNIPPPHTECEWVVTAPAGERLHFEFLERFDVTASFECRQAYVELRDGATDNSALIGRFCRDMPGSQYTVGNMLHVRFFTDVTDPKNGFKANISLASCGGTLRGQAGHLTLPSYPGPYLRNLDCSWRLMGQPDHFLTLWFDELSMPFSRNCSVGDYVTLSESLPDNATAVSELARYCTKQTRPTAPVNSTSNEVAVTFHSGNRANSNIDHTGFSLRYNTSQEACGGLLEGSSGVFQSPGYPSTQGYRRYCKWDITVPEGRRIKIELLDFDLETSMEAARHRLLFLDGIRHAVAGKWLYATNTPEIVRSTGNTMRVIFVSYHNVGHRGFKARYTSDEPSLCLGDLNGDSGYIRPPSPFLNLTYFHCEWERTVPGDTNKTIAFTMLNGTFGNQRRQTCYYQGNMAAITTKSNQNMYVGDFCGNYTTPETVLSPYMDVVVVASQSYSRSVEFVLQYRVHNCGGILHGPQDVVSSPAVVNGSTHCAWAVSYPSGSVVNMTFIALKLHGDCNSDYLLVRNGHYRDSPLLHRYCGGDATTLPAPVLSETGGLWIEFHSEATNQDQGFQLRLEAVFEGCGGIFQTPGSAFTSPKFPANYPPNSECTWDIKMQEGYFISLSFIERFDIEQSTGCTQDFIQIFDRLDDTWVLMKTLCGRTAPPTVNSTSSQMRVLFRSNSGGSNSGFKARFDVNCGGVIANSSSGSIISPGFPTRYGYNLNCNYTILSPGRHIILEFEAFELEGSWDCYFDWLKIFQKNPWMNSLDLLGKYCGTNAPPPLRIKEMALLSFKTDSSVNYKGFLIKYRVDTCGGNMTAPGPIASPHFQGRYMEDVNCTWYITAPAGNIIFLKFSTFDVEFSGECRFDFVRVLNGFSASSNSLLGQFCGNLSEAPPLVYSRGNQMLVHFKSDYSGNFPGFTATAIFQTACGNTLTLDTTTITLQPRADSPSDRYVSCRWTMLGARDRQIQLAITAFNPRPCTTNNTTVTSNCSCSYVEVRDGPGPYSELIQRFCDSNIPATITSSANQMFLLFVSENGVGVNTFRATVASVQSLCGPTILNVTSSYQELTSPGYPSSYPANLRCRWFLYDNDWQHSFDLHFVDLDLEPSTGCTADYVSFEDQYVPYDRNPAIEGLGQNVIYNGGNNRQYQSFYMGTRAALTKSTFCGRGPAVDYYTHSNAVQITFGSNGAVSGKGFKIRYAVAGCNRNYTGVQGRIRLDNVATECTITVQAPPNATIALYFLQFHRDASDGCASSATEVRDGPSRSSALMARVCGYELPNPIFSTGNVLWIHADAGSTYSRLDATYTTTDQGRGCGGQLFNYGGVFTSPLYPANYRNASVCRWDVSVPVGSQPLLKFIVFDIGARSTCSSDFVEIYDVDLENNLETFISRYCGEDNPAMHEGTTGTISVRYTTSVHNGGTGWVAHFAARKPGENIYF